MSNSHGTKIIYEHFLTKISQEHKLNKSNKLHEFDQLRGKEKSSYLREDTTCNSYGSNKLEMDQFGEGLKFLSRVGRRRSSRPTTREGSEFVIFAKSPYDQKVIVLLHVDH
ncbi:hypothetical protein QL285_062602 [Trifolium repens]|nr:hypothetical protein QL285_062602 [Trifolium repens]